MDKQRERQLLRSILVTPEDNLPRLVYADFLSEHSGTVPCIKGGPKQAHDKTCSCQGTGEVSNGNQEYAEFIQKQIQLDTWVRPSYQKVRDQIEDELISQNDPVLRQDFSEIIGKVTFLANQRIHDNMKEREVIKNRVESLFYGRETKDECVPYTTTASYQIRQTLPIWIGTQGHGIDWYVVTDRCVRTNRGMPIAAEVGGGFVGVVHCPVGLFYGLPCWYCHKAIMSPVPAPLCADPYCSYGITQKAMIELISNHPIVAFHFNDVTPVYVEGKYQLPALPVQLAAILASHGEIQFPTDLLALDALSRAAVDYARDCVGLPRLYFKKGA